MAYCLLHNICLDERNTLVLPVPNVNEGYVDNSDGTESGEYKTNELL